MLSNYQSRVYSNIINNLNVSLPITIYKFDEKTVCVRNDAFVYLMNYYGIIIKKYTDETMFYHSLYGICICKLDKEIYTYVVLSGEHAGKILFSGTNELIYFKNKLICYDINGAYNVKPGTISDLTNGDIMTKFNPSNSFKGSLYVINYDKNFNNVVAKNILYFAEYVTIVYGRTGKYRYKHARILRSRDKICLNYFSKFRLVNIVDKVLISRFDYLDISIVCTDEPKEYYC